MAEYEYDIIVIGGGAAGLTVAAGAAQLGVKVLLAEKEPLLGGDCLHYGCVPSKTLIESSRTYHRMRHAEKYGLPKVELPPVDFKNVAARIKSVIGSIQVHDSQERFCGLGAKVLFGPAEFADEHTVRIDGEPYTGEKIVVAAGSSPVAPPIKGLGSVPYLTNKTIFSLDKLPDHLVVLGGGPIGMEMGQAFRRLGSKVTVIEKGDQILNKEDKDMAALALTSLQADGIIFHLETAITEVRKTAGGPEVLFTDRNGKPQAVCGDALLVAIGRAPNTEGLKLENAGVEYNRRGIIVGTRLRTSQDHIYAAGDINGGPQFTHAAGYQGGVVIANAVFHLPRRVDYTHLPWCTYIEPELASIGMNQTQAKKAEVEYTVWEEEFTGNDRAQAEGETNGKLKMLLNTKGKPIGVQIFGPHAGELINEWVAAMAGGVKLSAIAGAIHPYPTLGEINKRVAGTILSDKLFSDTVKKGLKFFFGFKGRACGLDE
jgi:pyruvate/2-oxoglutarate dehydrogenase complex dihydrolipoamide dehydrogenase (E3) component